MGYAWAMQPQACGTAHAWDNSAVVEGVRTFHGRRGRLGPRNVDALDRLLPRYGLDPGPVDVSDVFAPPVPVVVEIGCGKGESTVTLAVRQPGVGVIAVDVHEAGIATLLRCCEASELRNVRVFLGDGVELLRDRIPSASLAGLRAFFPDPWPKTRHHGRRLVRPELVALMADRLTYGGLLHVATDWTPYADQMLRVLTAEPLLRNTAGTGFAPRPEWRPVTAYERRGLLLGHEVRDLVFRRG